MTAATAASSSENNLISEDAQSKEANKQQQQQQNIKPNKFGSVKPPPPSTRIPKSAVVMPDGSSGHGFSLDVQFGVDLDSPRNINPFKSYFILNTKILFFLIFFSQVTENKAPVIESAPLTNTTKIVRKQIGIVFLFLFFSSK